MPTELNFSSRFSNYYVVMLLGLVRSLLVLILPLFFVTAIASFCPRYIFITALILPLVLFSPSLSLLLPLPLMLLLLFLLLFVSYD